MLDRLLGRVHDTEHGTPVLRGYLWWGLFARGVLLVALVSLLLVEGNVLAEWLLTLRVPFVSREDVGELTFISYSVIVVLLTVGAAARWKLLRRLDVTGQTSGSPDSLPVEEASAADDG